MKSPDASDDHIATLLVSCHDQRGIVAALAQVLYGHGANILDSDQHTDTAANQFFQRIRFDLADLHTDRQSLETAVREVAGRFEMRWRVAYERIVKRVAILVSRYDHCLYDLQLRDRSGELCCEIPLIISNHPDLEPVAEQFGLSFRYLPVTPETKSEQEARQLALLREEKVDLVVLARYMQVLSPEFVNQYPAQIINIHHSFLPAFVGGKPYEQAHERRVKLIGATAHYATADLDEGPIIDQGVVRCSHRDSVADLKRKVLPGNLWVSELVGGTDVRGSGGTCDRWIQRIADLLSSRIGRAGGHPHSAHQRRAARPAPFSEQGFHVIRG